MSDDEGLPESPGENRRLIYGVTAPHNNLLKIGYWATSLKALRARYATYYGPEAEFIIFSCERSQGRIVEKAIHERMSEFLYHSELFMKSDRALAVFAGAAATLCRDFNEMETRINPRPVTASGDTHQCPNCLIVFQDKYDLERHLNRTYPCIAAGYACACGRRYRHDSGLRRHKKTCKGRPETVETLTEKLELLRRASCHGSVTAEQLALPADTDARGGGRQPVGGLRLSLDQMKAAIKQLEIQLVKPQR